jgi:hypothetical protein
MAKRADRRVLNFHLYIVDEADVGDLHPLEIDQLSVEEQNFIEIVQEELDKFHENDLDGRTITIRGDRVKAKLDEKDASATGSSASGQASGKTTIE